MTSVTLIIFLATYAGIAFGRIPGLALDRTGVALVGAVAMIGCGALTLDQALSSIHAPTLMLLYALMIFSAQFRLGGFYTWVALALTKYLRRPRLFLLALMLISGALSALLANDVVCLAFTPVLCVCILRAGRNPLPYLLGLAISSNLGSAATIIGNPQNMLIGQVGRLDFADFVRWSAPPALLSLAAAYGLILALCRRQMEETRTAVDTAHADWPAFHPWQTTKGLVLLASLLVLFFTPIPRELSALVLAGILLCSRRMHTRAMLGLVDWHLITLFCGLFIVIEGIGAAGVPARLVAAMESAGVDLRNPCLLAAVSVILSNLVSNVPATMLLAEFLDAGNPVPWYVLALATTFAGNLLTIGSIANLIVIEQAAQFGVAIRFGAHARVGIPVTLASLAILAAWILLQL